MVNKVLWCNMMPIKPGTPGEPLIFSINALGGSFTGVHTQFTGPTALCPIRRTKHHGQKCLALKGHRCYDLESNPHSADQKHQSLSPVPLTARPRHAKVKRHLG